MIFKFKNFEEEFTLKKFKFFLFTIFLIFLSNFQSFATRTAFSNLPNIVSVDLPEGFYTVQVGSGQKSFLLESEILPVNAIIQIYEAKRFNSSLDAVNYVMKNFKLDFESESFNWFSKNSAISYFTGNLNGINSQGLCVATVIPENSNIILMLAWSAQENFANSYNYIASFFDGLYVDMNSYFSKGILTSYLDSEEMEDVSDEAKKSAQKMDVNLNIDSHQIKTQIFAEDSKFAQEFIEREYAVLCLYANHSGWQEAWQRYYRLIFRDSCSRLRKASFDIYNGLAPFCIDETDLAQKLLNWVQNFKYEREKTNSDFSNLPSILLGNGSDCDSRSLLLAVLLNAMNQDSCIFVSNEFSHAVAGFVSTHPGFNFEVNGKKYLIGETTAKNINWGNIEQRMAEQSKWIPVLLP